MPPPVIPGNPATYYASFSVSAGTAGFDIRGQGYSSTVEANQTVEPIPWGQTYSVVRHYAGLNPHKRQYQIIFWYETDFVNFAVAVGGVGTLSTPREGSVLASLDRVERLTDTDRTTPVGMTTATAIFTILQ